MFVRFEFDLIIRFFSTHLSLFISFHTHRIPVLANITHYVGNQSIACSQAGGSPRFVRARADIKKANCINFERGLAIPWTVGIGKLVGTTGLRRAKKVRSKLSGLV